MSAKLIKELRERTGAGFLDCKKALDASEGNIEKAIAWLQERGSAKAAKKAGAIAAEGVVRTIVSGKKAVIFELNSQTDFVAKNEQFKSLVKKVENALIGASFKNADEANAIKVGNMTIAQLCIEATAAIGEKIVLRRAQVVEGDVIGAYTHVNERVAAIVVTEGGNSETTRNVAMHVASMNPKFLDQSSVPSETIKEFKKEIEQSPAMKNKPENIKDNIAKGMLQKKLSELTLVDQEFVMEKMSVAKYLKQFGATAKFMIRFEVGEGLEKETTDFASEVAAQMNS